MVQDLSVAVQLELIKNDFRNFMAAIWKYLKLTPTDVQFDVAHWLQHGPSEAMIMAYRGAGKSWISSAYALWCLLRNPQERILVVSASKDRADSFSTFTKRLITEVPFLRHLAPRPGQRDSNISFDVGPSEPAQAPSVKSVGITGQMTGSRATIIIADDIETPNNSLTVLMRERLSERIKEFDSIILPGGKIIYLGTPQSQESIYELLPERGFTLQIWPARIPMADKVANYKGRLAPFVTDMIANGAPDWAPVDPKRFDDRDLSRREGSYGRSGFGLQFMLDTELSDLERYPLKLFDLMVFDVHRERAPVQIVYGSGEDQKLELDSPGFVGDHWHGPMYYSKDEWEPYQHIVMFIDPSGRGKDETGFAIVGQLRGTLWGMDWGGLEGGYSDATMLELARRAKEFKVHEILIEPNFGDGMFRELFIPFLKRVGHHASCEDAPWANTMKEARIIDTLEPVFNQHRMVFDRSRIKEDIKDGLHSLFYQLTRLTRDPGAIQFDDRADAMAGAVARHLESMSLDSDSAEREFREQKRQEELDKFMNQFHQTRTTNGWFDEAL